VRAAAAAPDVVVVGAGPAGSATAITLARAGAAVVVVDRARFPRDKCCGDGLTASALRHLEELGLDPAAVPSWTPVREVALRSPSGRTVGLGLPPDGLHAAVARRSDLDAALLHLARDAGACVLEDTAVTAVDRDGRGARVGTGRGGTFAPGYVVAADGAWSPTRKLLGDAAPAGRYLGDWHALRQYVTGVGAEAARRLWVWFEPDLLPGYAWSFPLGGGRANVGYGVPRRPGVRSGPMGALWEALLARPHIRAVLGEDARPEAPVRAWPIPATADRALLTGMGGRVLFTGDAARATDPMTGEGIGQALESGIAAARSILGAGPGDPEGAARAYTAELAAGLLRDNRLAALLSRQLGSARGARAAVRAAGLSAWTRANFARWMWEDYPRAVLATPHRWRRRMLHPPGAFAVPGGGTDRAR
jgi:menaquinone-9 beta-reductase